MKKILLGTSALALAGAIASPAASAEWTVRVGGYMEQFIGYASSDLKGDFSFPGCDGDPCLDPNGDFDGIDSKQDGEIFFLPSITLDNGIKIGANIQLEGLSQGAGDQIDESYMYIKGSFGEILLGSENSAGYKMTYAAPDVTFINVNSGSLTSFIPFSGAEAGADIFRGTLGSSYLENARNNDAQRFTYFTPRFSGFQMGVSYARDGRQDDNTQVDTDAELHDLFDVGANYVNSFGDFNVALSGRYGIASVKGESDPEVWAVGLNLGMSGFTIGGSYGEQDNAGTMDGEVYDLGISYETGPWGFSFTYFHGENQGNPDAGAVAAHVGLVDLDMDPLTPDTIGIIAAVPAAAERGDEEVDQYLVAISYDLAKGVNIGGYAAYIDFDDASGGTNNDSVDGFIIGTGIKVKF